MQPPRATTQAASVRFAEPHEYDQVFELIERLTGSTGVAITTTTVRNDTRFRPELLRVVRQNGQIVGVVHVIDRLVHIGTALVRCAIVAPLVVATEYQGQGIGSALMRDMLPWARSHHFLVSMLWGHSWLYPRYGYAPGIKRYDVIVPASLLPLGDQAYSLRPYTAGDASAVMQVYHAETGATTLAEVRSDEPWEWRPHDPQTIVEVALDPAGSIRGYFRANQRADQLHVGEIAAMDAGAAQTLYDRLLHLARQHAAHEIHVNATPNNRWSKLAFGRGAKLCISSGDRAGMVRVLDLPALLRAIQPELARRITRSEFATGQAAVRIETPVGRATLRIDNGRIAIDESRVRNSVTLPFHALGPLVAGYQSMNELATQPGVFMEGRETQRMLEVLFPEGYPHWSFAPYFG